MKQLKSNVLKTYPLFYSFINNFSCFFFQFLERINANKNQIHKCISEDCGKEFKLRSQLAKHCSISHGLIMRSGSPRPIFKSLSGFYLNTTPLTRAARLECLNVKSSAKNPFKSVDFAKLKAKC